MQIVSRLEVGKEFDHPRHGRVKIVQGWFRNPVTHAIDNYWRWRRLNQRGVAYGRTEAGNAWM